MKAEYPTPHDSLAFPIFFEETAGPEVEGPTRFARALKRARFARGWTQAALSGQLAIPKRSIVSWETGERIPSVGMVMLLLDALFPGEELSLRRELVTAYIAEDLERMAQRRGPQHGHEDPLLQRAQRVMVQVLQRSTTGAEVASARSDQEAVTRESELVEEQEPPQPQGRVDEQQALEPLFALMAQLRHHPELIPVTRDFLHELVPDE